MTGGVDDVDFYPAIDDGRILGHDGDPLFALKVQAVMTRSATCWFSRKMPLCQSMAIHQCGLAVIHMGDDGQITLSPERFS